MGLENRTPAKYLSIYNGKIRHKTADGDVYYDSLTGRLDQIELREETFKGNTFNKWYFHFKDNGELYMLKSGEGTVFANSLVNSLAGCDLSRPVRISPYTKVYDDSEIAVPYVEQDGEAASWAIEDWPDESDARNALVRRMVKRLNELTETVEPDPTDDTTKTTSPKTDAERDDEPAPKAAAPLQFPDDDLPF